jgi:tRNA pseudouridine38-40 synthase
MVSHQALGIAYQGSQFHGWQYQSPTVPTVQAHVEQALSIVADEPISVVCAGRTDTGVSATKQVVSFSTQAQRPEKAWVRGVNAHLPDSVSVTFAAAVDEGFSARHSATARRYFYLIYPARVRHALFASGYTRTPMNLDVQRMHAAGQALLGENDFTSFRASKCQANSPMRNVHHLEVRAIGEVIVVDIQANAFLHHMVRNIVGVLMDIGSGRYPIEWMAELLAKRDRTAGSVTAPPMGLYLVDVVYPDYEQVPRGPALPHLFQSLAVPALSPLADN